jgi:D-beta-D-heptose 7-phosphate kinase / D-beta-D-heptose 1-phosphate adenosyltransferase
MKIKKQKNSGLLPDFSKARIVVVGDVMLDRYWQGDTNRISPESPVPLVHVRNITERPGGAGNVALNIGSLGAKATLLGNVGQDGAAMTLVNILEEAKVKCCLQYLSELPTINKLRVLSRNQQLIRLDFEENFHAVDSKKLIASYQAELVKANAVIISDYGKGIASCAKKVITLARAKKIPVLVDPKGKDFGIYQGATLITPNLGEFEAVVGNCSSDKDIVKKAVALVRKLEINAILVTRGAHGMSLIQANGKYLHIPAHAHEVFDVTGAGDTVIGVLASALAVGQDLVSSAQIANIAAGIVVLKLGAATVSVPELRRAIQRRTNSWLGIVSLEELLQEVADARAHGETIVMTNGCFDILHAGHVAYLQQAKALGKRLIVAINDDNSVRRLKGKERPINPLKQRMRVLAGLRSIDWIVPFSEATPEKLIKKVNPDILVKGGDYKVEQIAGSDFVIKQGGKVVILDFVKGCSGTSIVNAIKRGKK